MSVNKLAGMRRHYEASELTEENAPPLPFDLFRIWFKEAHETKIIEPNAMTLATASSKGMPSARIVLLKEMTEKGFVFFTNYQSHKAKDMEENPYAALVFLWDILERQVRIQGKVEKVAESVSVDYFNSRPRGSQIGSIISPQSQKIESKEALIERYKDVEKSADIKKPDHWGGYILLPSLIEFWQGRPNRLHDRIVYESDGYDKWIKYRLAP